MRQEILLAIIITSMFWLIIFLIGYYNYKLKTKMALSNKELDIEKEKNLIHAQHRTEKQNEFDRGYLSGVRNNDFIIHVDPYKNMVNSRAYFKTSKIIEIGYLYRLHVKGVPCLDPHVQIVERIKLDDINEENIKSIISKIETLINRIPSPHLKLATNVKDFGNEILKSIKSKSKRNSS